MTIKYFKNNDMATKKKAAGRAPQHAPRAIRFPNEIETMVKAYGKEHARTFHGSVLAILEEYRKKHFKPKTV